MRTRSLAVLRRTSRMMASQSRAGLKPTPPLPISASDVREAADLRMPPPPPPLVVGPRILLSLCSCLLFAGSTSWFREEAEEEAFPEFCEEFGG